MGLRLVHAFTSLDVYVVIILIIIIMCHFIIDHLHKLSFPRRLKEYLLNMTVKKLIYCRFTELYLSLTSDKVQTL